MTQATTPTLQLNNGVTTALDAGYRHIDTAAAIDGLDTGRRGGPEPDAITLEQSGREIPEA